MERSFNRFHIQCHSSLQTQFAEKWSDYNSTKTWKHITKIPYYSPLALMPILSKVYGKIVLQQNEIIPDFQIWFSEIHSNIKQVHRIVKYCIVLY